MRRLRRALAVAFVLLVVLAVGLYLAARAYLASESVRRQVAAHLAASYGGPVEVDGADIGVLGGSTIRGLRLYEPGESQTPWASAGTVTMDVSALDLLRGVAPRRLTLDGPKVTLHLDSGGRLLTHMPEAGSAERSPPDIHIESGQVTIQQDGRPEMVVKGVRADLRPDGGRVAITGGVSDSYWGEWSLDGSADRAADSLIATLTTDRAEVTHDKLLRLPVVPPTVWREVNAEGATSVAFTFRHGAGAHGANHYRVVLRPDTASVALPALDLNATDVRGGITIEDAVVTLAKVTGQTLGGEMTVDGTLDFRGTESVLRLGITAQRLEVRQVPESWDFDERLRKLGGKLSGRAALTVAIGGGVRTSGEGRGEITGVMLGGQRTTIDLRLHPTRKGFKLGAPAEQSRPSTPPRGRGPGDGDAILAALILLQGPAQSDASITRNATRAIHDGVKAVGGGLIDAGRKAVGALPTGDISRPAPADAPPAYLDISLNLKDVDLAQLVKDLEIKLPFPVSGRLSMKVQASLPVNHARDLKLYKVTGSATLPTFSLSGVDMNDVAARVRYDNGILRLEELRGRLAGTRPPAGTFEGSARLGLVPEGDLTADLKLTAVPVAQIVRAAGVALEVGGDVSGSADLRVPSGRLRDPSTWQGSAKLTAGRVSAYGWALTDAGATVRVGDGLLTIRDATGQLEGAPVSGSAEAKLTAPYTYQGQLELAKGDLTRLRRLAPEVRPPLAVEGRFGVTGEVSGTLRPFTAKVSGTGTGTGVKVEKVRVDSLRFRWAKTNDVLKVSDIKAGLYEGDLTGSVDVPLAAKREGKVDVHADGVDVGALLRDVPQVPLRVEGKASGSVKGTLTAGEARSFDGELELSAPRLVVQNLSTEKLTGTISYRQGAGEYHLKGGLLGGTFELDGRIPPRPAGAAAPPTKPEQADSRLRLRGAQLGRLGESLNLRGPLDQLHGRVDLDVEFRLEPVHYAPVGTGNFTITRLRWGDQTISDSLRGDVILADGEARLRNLSGQLGGGELRGYVALRLRDLDRSLLSVGVDGADAARVLAPWPSLAANVSGSLDARLRGTLGRHWQGGGSIILTRGKVLGVEVSEWRVPLRFDVVPARGRAQLDIDDMSATVAHGRLTGRGSLGFGDGTRLDGHLRFSGVDMRALLRPFTESTSLGAGTTSGRVEISGSNVRSLDDVTATVDASFAQAQAFQLPVLAQLLPFIAPGQSSTTFQSGDLRGRLSRGIFRVQRLSLSGNVAQLFADGTVTTTGRLNLDVIATTRLLGIGTGALRLMGLRLPLAGPMPLTLLLETTNYLASTSIHLVVGGTLRSPAVRVEPLSLVTEEAARFFLLRGSPPP
jgi:hypothetical protein